MPRPDWAADPESRDLVGTEIWSATPYEDHRVCTSECAYSAVPSPLERERPPDVRCDWCGAPPGVACTWRAPGGRVRSLSTYGRFHPSRLHEARAA